VHPSRPQASFLEELRGPLRAGAAKGSEELLGTVTGEEETDYDT
jgi:hypothetical protein